MKVTINFKIDKELLDVAIRHLIYNKMKVTRKNILFVIKCEVQSKGTSCIDFIENWGDDLLEYDYNEDYVEKQVIKFSNLIGL